VALCLNSSFLGYFAHAGFLRELLATGVRPVAVSGASAGALVAGLLAAGKSPEEMLRLFLSPELQSVFREPGAPWRGLATILNLPGHTGALHGRGALALLKKHLGERRIEDCLDPRLTLSVTNLGQARCETVTRGPLAEYILASGAFPGFFAAQAVEESWYWDGGVANALPFDHWVTDPGIDTILVHVVANPGELAVREIGRPRKMSMAVNLSHQIICDELLRLKTDLVRHSGKRLVLLRTTAPRPNLWNPARIGAACVAEGAATVAEHRDVLVELAS
jgi:NTE family protein